MPGLNPIQDGSFSPSSRDYLAALCAAVCRRFTGVFYATDGKAKKLICLRGGAVAFALSNKPGERLEEQMIRAGTLSSDKARVAVTQSASQEQVPVKLMELEYASFGPMAEACRSQVQTMMMDLSSWARGDFVFREGEPEEKTLDFSIDVTSILVQSVISLQDRRWVLNQLGSMRSVYSLKPEFCDVDLQPGIADVITEALATAPEKRDSGPSFQHTPELTAGLAVSQIFQDINGTHTIRDVLSLSTVDEFTAAKIITVLKLFGLLDEGGSEGAPQDSVVDINGGRAPVSTSSQDGPRREPAEPDVRAEQSGQEAVDSEAIGQGAIEQERLQTRPDEAAPDRGSAEKQDAGHTCPEEDDPGDDVTGEVESEDEPEAEVTAVAESEDEPEAEVTAVAESEDEPEAEVTAVAESEDEPEAEVTAVAESEDEPEAEVTAVAESEDEPEAEVAAVAESEDEPEAEVTAVAESEDEPEAEVTAVGESEDEPEVEDTAVVESEDEPEAEVTTVAESEDEPEAEVTAVGESQADPGDAVTAEVESEDSPGNDVSAVPESEIDPGEFDHLRPSPVEMRSRKRTWVLSLLGVFLAGICLWLVVRTPTVPDSEVRDSARFDVSERLDTPATRGALPGAEPGLEIRDSTDRTVSNRLNMPAMREAPSGAETEPLREDSSPGSVELVVVDDIVPEGEADQAPETETKVQEPPRADSAALQYDAEGIRKARSLLEREQYAAAARLYLLSLGTEGHTISLAILCSPTSIGADLRSIDKEAPYFVVPFRLKDGRDCYRVLWGRYGSKEEALAQKSTIPDRYREALPDLDGLVQTMESVTNPH